MIFNLNPKSNWFKSFEQNEQENFLLSGVTEGAEAFVINRFNEESAVIFVAKNDKHLSKVKSYLKIITPHKRILEFPAWDIVPYGRTSPSAHIQSNRLKTLAFLAQKNNVENHVILTTINALSQYIIPQKNLREAGQILKTASTISPENLTKILNHLGYKHVSLVREAGEYAVRGGLIDIYPSGEDKGFRLDFFGDEIESISLFDPVSQRSYEKTSELTLIPASEVLLNDTTIKNFRKAYRYIAPVTSKNDMLYTAISEGLSWPAMEHWLPLFYTKLESFLDYIDNSVPIILPFEFYSLLKERLDNVKDYYQSRLNLTNENSEEIYAPVESKSFFETEKTLKKRLACRKTIQLSPFIESKNSSFIESKQLPLFYESQKGYKSLLETFEEWMREQKQKHYIILTKTQASRQQIERLFKNSKFSVVIVNCLQEALKVKAPHITLLLGNIDRGITYEDITFIADTDLIGKSYKLIHKKRRVEDVILQASSLSEGDYVVHTEHGIGRYESLETIKMQNIEHDCLKLIYEGGDRLFVPVENIEILSRYGGESERVSLDKLGGAAWQARRARAKERINELAEKLVAIAAQRQVKKAYPIKVPDGTFEEFCMAFPYTETDDQLHAIEDVISDLSSGKIMDRLVCGDVGFGKTEVALRAAFLSVMSGYQVAIIVPTTLLARQHYNSFVCRFKDFPVRVAQLSRMVSPKKAKQTKQEMKEGKVDIIIGTHALLSKDISFDRLHLVIVDEEQHFGVTHKEKLKALRHNVHMLTLTATPIPRTLQMALTGVRDLSIIATPPVDRLAIRTFIQKYDTVTVREALLRENFRGGQSFFVCPRLKDVRHMEEKLTKLLPELKIGVAHGKMPVKQLEETITAFINEEFDILLSTQIVESGIDMPNVNTIIIYRPDMFGLAQLYQLRGRVGRGNIRAWAWLVLDPRRKISPAAMKRLEVMQTLDNLGAGFSIASHDLDQRGAGNLLGEEQSGHIKEVGIELYQKMIEEAVNKAKDNPSIKQEDIWSTRINIGLTVMIPQDYISDLDVRMNLYRKIANIQDLEEQGQMEAELMDRFGALPQAVKNLLSVTQVKQRCKKIGIIQLDAGEKAVVVQFYNNIFKNPEGLINFIAQNATWVKLRPDQSIVFTKKVTHERDKMLFIDEILSLFENLIEAAH